MNDGYSSSSERQRASKLAILSSVCERRGELSMLRMLSREPWPRKAGTVR
jgi:hypothetical protein